MPGIMEYLNINISRLPYVNALVALFIFVAVAKIVDVLVDRFFRRFARFTKSEVDDRIIDAVHRPIYFTIILLGCAFSVGYLKGAPGVIFYTDSAAYSAIVIVWAITATKVANILIEHFALEASDDTGLRKDIVPLVENVFKVVLIGAAIMLVLTIWKINITPLLASAGIVGVAIAIAAKDTLSNFFGGISIFVDRPYKIGDYIVLQAGERGEVVAIGIRSTRIKTRDDILISVPNSLIANSKIINESAPMPNFRVRIPVSVAYGSDIDVVERILLEIASMNENVLAEPAPRVRFREFGDSALIFELLCWARDPALRGRTIHDLNCLIYKNFNTAGITIPFPQRDLHIHSQ